jgi:hypothetical protein
VLGLEVVASEIPYHIWDRLRPSQRGHEQYPILASHPQVFGAGELGLTRDDFEAQASQADAALEVLARLDQATAHRLGEQHLGRLRELNADRPCVADKMPDNYLYLGLLAALFPKAKFIHCRRGLRDVAVSCWMTNFRHIR